MQCPYCDGDSVVLDSRTTTEGVRRRRSCEECKRRFTTYEKLAGPNIKVTKRRGRVEPFTGDKILAILRRITRDRSNVSPDDVASIARAVEAQLVDSGAKSVSSGEIVGRVLDRLAEIDRLSYERLAANYVDEHGQLRILARTGLAEDHDQLTLFKPDSEK